MDCIRSEHLNACVGTGDSLHTLIPDLRSGSKDDVLLGTVLLLELLDDVDGVIQTLNVLGTPDEDCEALGVCKVCTGDDSGV